MKLPPNALDGLNQAIIPEGITQIDCPDVPSKLASITIPNSVKEISRRSFYETTDKSGGKHYINEDLVEIIYRGVSHALVHWGPERYLIEKSAFLKPADSYACITLGDLPKSKKEKFIICRDTISRSENNVRYKFQELQNVKDAFKKSQDIGYICDQIKDFRLPDNVLADIAKLFDNGGTALDKLFMLEALTETVTRLIQAECKKINPNTKKLDMWPEIYDKIKSERKAPCLWTNIFDIFKTHPGK